MVIDFHSSIELTIQKWLLTLIAGVVYWLLSRKQMILTRAVFIEMTVTDLLSVPGILTKGKINWTESIYSVQFQKYFINNIGNDNDQYCVVKSCVIKAEIVVFDLY